MNGDGPFGVPMPDYDENIMEKTSKCIITIRINGKKALEGEIDFLLLLYQKNYIRAFQFPLRDGVFELLITEISKPTKWQKVKMYIKKKIKWITTKTSWPK